MSVIKFVFLLVGVIVSLQYTSAYSSCFGRDRCSGTYFWCCLDYSYYPNSRRCCQNFCSTTRFNYCIKEPEAETTTTRKSYTYSHTNSGSSTVIIVVPTIISLVVIGVIVAVLIRCCCCARRPPPQMVRPQQTVTVIRSNVTSPPMQPNPYQGGMGVYPPPVFSGGYTNTGYVNNPNMGNPYPPVSSAYPPQMGYMPPPPVSEAYPPQTSHMPPIESSAAPPPPYSQYNHQSSKQPAYNPEN